MRVPARSEAAALQRYKGFLNQTLSCASKAVWRAGKRRAGGDSLTILLSEDPARLRRLAGPPLYFKATQNFHIGPDPRPERAGEFKVFTDGYAYTLTESADLHDELLAWHWHPGTVANDMTHLHVGHGHDEHGGLARWHIPTGRVLFEDVIGFAIRELGVRPERVDWETIAGDVTARVKQYWSWA